MGTPEQDLREYLNRVDADDALDESVNDKIDQWMEDRDKVLEYLDAVLEWCSDGLTEQLATALSSDDSQAWGTFGAWIEEKVRNSMTEDAKTSVQKEADQLATDVAVDREELRRGD